MIRARCVFALLALLAFRPAVARAQDTAFPAQPPPDAPTLSVHPPLTVRQTLPNGLHVVIQESHSVPTVYMKMGIRAGIVSDPPEIPYLSEFAFLMVEQGTKKYDLEKRDKEATGLGGDLTMAYAPDYVNVAAHCLAQNSGKMLDLIADTLMNSKLDPDLIGGFQQILEKAAKQRRLPTGEDAEKKHYPYVRHTPTAATEKRLDMDSVIEFLNNYWCPNNAILVIAGDINAETVLKQIKSSLGSWKRGNPPSLPKFDVEPVVPFYNILIVDDPTAIESKIQLQCNVPNLEEKDKLSLQLAESILGGSIDSRLFRTVREKYGYVYGINSALQFNAFDAEVFIVTQCRSAVTARCLKQIEVEIDRMDKEPVPEDELQRAQNYLARKYDLVLQSQEETAAELFQIEFYKRPVDYFRQLRGKINALTAADVLRAAKKYMFPGGSALVVVTGPKEKIVDKIMNANVGYVLNPD